MNLTKCLPRVKSLTDDQKNKILATAKAYREQDGLSHKDAAIESINDMIAEVLSNRADVVSEIKRKGGEASDYIKVEPAKPKKKEKTGPQPVAEAEVSNDARRKEILEEMRRLNAESIKNIHRRQEENERYTEFASDQEKIEKKKKRLASEFESLKEKPKDHVEVTFNGKTDTVDTNPSEAQIEANVYKKEWSSDPENTKVPAADYQQGRRKKTTSVRRWTIGKEVSFRIGQSSLRPSRKEIKDAADYFGITQKEASRSLAIYNDQNAGGKDGERFVYIPVESPLNEENTKVPAADWKKDKPEKVAKAEKKPVTPEAKVKKPAETLANKPEEGVKLADTEDVGGEMGYNRRQKGISLDDVKSAENDAKKLVLAQKKMLWERPNYQEMADKTIHPIIAHNIKQIYDSIPNKPARKEDKYIFAYVEAVEATRNAVDAFLKDKAKMIDALKAVNNQYKKQSTQTIISSFVKQPGEEAKPEDYFLDAVFPENEDGSRWGRGNTEGNDRAVATGNRFYKNLTMSVDSFVKAMKAMEEGWPAKAEAWQRSYKVQSKDQVVDVQKAQTFGKDDQKPRDIYLVRMSGRTVERFDTQQEADAAVDAMPEWYLVKKKYSSVVDTYDGREEAIEAVRELTKKDKIERFKEPAVAVEKSVRKGRELREGKNVSTEDLKNIAGFKAINFGNWMQGNAKAKERQAHVNSIYDAVHDLAEVLGVPVKAISLNGMLGLAVGAQGRSSNAAHFVPGLNEINITRGSGAGSLAHEFGHGLDHYFAMQAGMAKTDDPFLSAAAYLRKESEIRPEIADKFKTIYQAMTKIEKGLSKEEIEEYRTEGLSRSKKFLESWLKGINQPDKPSMRYNSLLKKIRAGDVGKHEQLGKSKDYVGANVNALRNEHKKLTGRMFSTDAAKQISMNAGSVGRNSDAEAYHDKHPKTQTVKTQYARSALEKESKSGKAYWSTPWEMFARAFEIYVMDRLAAKEQRNDYLTSAWKNEEDGFFGEEANKRYPRGMEREQINHAFDGLIEELKTKETPEGVALFSETTRTGKSIGVAAVEKAIAPILLKWFSAPKVIVVKSISDLPERIRKAAEGKTVDGVYDGGTVYLVADNIISPKQAQMVLAHEAVGHFSMEEMLGDEFGDILKRVQMLKKLGSKRVKEIAQEVAGRYEGLTETEEAQEIIAVMAEKGIKNSLMKRVYAAVRRFLRSIGFSVMFTETELEALVAKAGSRMGQRRAAQQGQAAGSEAFSQRDAKKQALAWYKTSTVEGKPAFKSDDITLVPVNEVDTGEGSTGDVLYDEVDNGFSDHGLMGHASKVRPGERVIQYTLHDRDRAIGSLHAGVMDGKISSIHDIYIEDQGEGLGEKVVATIAANSDDVLIADITPDAQAFWEKMGVDYVNVDQDATLNWEGYSQARAAAEGQRAGDERADEQGATGVSEGLSQEAKDFFERELGGPKFSRRGRDDRASDELKEKLGLSKKNTSLMQFVRDVRDTDWGETKRHHEDEWTQGALDRFYGIKSAEDEYAGRIDASQSGYVAARLSTGLSSIVTATLHYGTPQWKEGILQKIPDSKGLLEIFEPVGDEINDWLAWMAGKRASRLMAEGREHNLTDEDISEALALSKGREDQFQAVADEYAKFMSQILDIAEQSGLIDSNSRKMWEHADYVPFYRMTVDSMFKKGPKGRKGMSHQSSGIRRLRGSELATNDLLENIVMNVTHLLDASVKNNALGKTLRNLKGTGVYEDATMEFKKELIPMSQVKQQIKRNLKNMGMDKMQIDEYMDTLPPEVIEGMQKLWAIKAPSDPDVVRVMVQGKARYYRVNDPLLVRALTQVNAEKTHTVPMEIARSFKRILTATVTSTPEFMLRNFIRDAAHAWTISDDSFTPLVDSVRGAGKTLKLWSKDVDHAAAGGAVDMMFAGGSFLGGYIHGNDPTQTATAIRAALRKRGYSAASADEFMSTIIDTPAKYWERYREIGDAIENASREAVYEAAMKASKSKAQAIFEAKDLMDYSMQGQWGLFQGMGDVIPFFNARLQGLYKLKRAGAIPGWASKAKVLARGGVITGLSLALLALNWDDDRYEALEDWDKDAYWHFFIGDHHSRIPKPFEVGVIYGTIPERMARHFGGKDDTKKAMKQLLWNFRETLNLVQMPQIVKPIAEIWANKDTFTERPIENMADEGKLKSAMYNEHTSATMRKLGEAFSDDIGLSPKQLQHLWRGYLGSLGMYALGVTDMATRWATDAPTRPELRPEDIPVLKSFYRGKGPARSTRYKTELYEMLRDVDKTYRTIRSYGMQGREEDAQELLEKNKGKLAIRQGLSAGSMGLKQIRMNIDMIMRDTEKTKKEKRQEIDELMETANQMTKKIVEATYPIYSAN